MGATQQKIAALSDKLAPLAQKKTGMPIEADDWNALVAVVQGVLEVDRTQDDQQLAQLSQGFAPIGHEHLGQVTAAWLAPDLQAKLSAAGGDTNLLLRIGQMEAQLAAINHQLAQLSALADAHQTAIDRYGVNDLNRAGTIRDLTAKIGTVTGIQTALNAATSDLAGLKTNVQTVLDLRRSLSNPDGTPINVAGLQQNITDLQKLRDNLKGIDGTPVRFSDVELRLKDVEDSVGTGATGGLDGRITAVVSAAETRLKTAQSDAMTALHAQSTEDAGRQISAGQASLQQALDARFASAAQANKTAVDQGIAALRAETADRINGAVATAQQSQVGATKALIAQQMGTVPGLINSSLVAARSDLLRASQDAATAQIATAVQTAVTASEARLTDRLSTAQTQIQQNLAALETRVRTEYTSAIGTLRDQTAGNISDRFNTLQQGLSATVAAQVKSEVAVRLPEITASTQAAVAQGLAAQDAHIAQSVADATKALPDTVASQVKLQIAALDVDGKITTATSRLTDQYRAEIAAGISAQQDRVTTSINGAMTQLRGEVAVAQTNATRDAIASASSTIGAARNDFAVGINNLRTEVQTNLNQATTKMNTEFNARFATQAAANRNFQIVR
jgi:hypothetical protein